MPTNDDSTMDEYLVKMHIARSFAKSKVSIDDFIVHDVTEIPDNDVLRPTNHGGVFLGIYEALFVSQATSNVNVRIPSTVVYRYNKPFAWYESRRNSSGKWVIMKKKPTSLNNAIVLGSFLKKANDPLTRDLDLSGGRLEAILPSYLRGAGPAAGASSASPGKRRESVTRPDTDESDDEGGHEREAARNQRNEENPFVAYFVSADGVRYFDRHELQSFLLLSKEKSDGVLQTIVAPKRTKGEADHYETVRCSWSPLLSYIERRRNVYTFKGDTMKDRFADQHNRVETFEGKDYTTTVEAPVTSKKNLSNIKEQCGAMVDQLHRVSHFKLGITSMLANMRILEGAHIMLMWIDSVQMSEVVSDVNKLEDGSSVVRQHVEKEYHSPEKMSLETKHRLHQMVNFRDKARCRICDGYRNKKEITDVQYGMLLASTGEVWWSSDRREQEIKRLDRQRRSIHPRSTSILEVHRSKTQAAADISLLFGSEAWKYQKVTSTSFTEPLKYEGKRLPPPPESRLVDIPAFVKKLHPYMTQEHYMGLRGREDFRSLKVKTCSSCLFRLTKEMASTSSAIGKVFKDELFEGRVKAMKSSKGKLRSASSGASLLSRTPTMTPAGEFSQSPKLSWSASPKNATEVSSPTHPMPMYTGTPQATSLPSALLTYSGLGLSGQLNVSEYITDAEMPAMGGSPMALLAPTGGTKRSATSHCASRLVVEETKVIPEDDMAGSTSMDIHGEKDVAGSTTRGTLSDDDPVSSRTTGSDDMSGTLPLGLRPPGRRKTMSGSATGSIDGRPETAIPNATAESQMVMRLMSNVSFTSVGSGRGSVSGSEAATQDIYGTEGVDRWSRMSNPGVFTMPFPAINPANGSRATTPSHKANPLGCRWARMRQVATGKERLTTPQPGKIRRSRTPGI